MSYLYLAYFGFRSKSGLIEECHTFIFESNLNYFECFERIMLGEELKNYILLLTMILVEKK